MAGIQKARYWWAVLYPENMIDGWEELVGDAVQVPFAYCVHSADTDGKSEHRKDHVHLIIVFSNTTTYDHALNVFKLLGEKAVNTCQAVVNIRHAYDYLIHDTETCRKAGKHLYDPSERVLGNNFDIGSYEQLGIAEKNEIFIELSNVVRDNAITNYMDFYEYVADSCADMSYFEVMRAYSSHFERLCRGNFQREIRRNNAVYKQKTTEKTTENHGKRCPKCGSDEVIKRGKTAGGTQRFYCKNCEKKFM